MQGRRQRARLRERPVGEGEGDDEAGGRVVASTGSAERDEQQQRLPRRPADDQSADRVSQGGRVRGLLHGRGCGCESESARCCGSLFAPRRRGRSFIV